MTSSGHRRTRGCCARSNHHFRGVTKTVCVDADLSRVPSVSATEAAERLCVSLDGLNARLAEREDAE